MADNITVLTQMGLPVEQARFYLEMAGGNLEAAVAMYFDQGAAAGPVADVEVRDMEASIENAIPKWWDIVWPKRETPDPSWTKQSLQFCDEKETGWNGGIIQPKNGPCGVLAIINGLLLLDGAYQKEPNKIKFNDNDIGRVILSILLMCRPKEDAPVIFANPKESGNYAPNSEIQQVECGSREKCILEISKRIERFKGPGGIIDLIYSAMLTRGADQVKQDIAASGGEGPLVYLAINSWFCTTELMSLLLRGEASGNVGAFNAIGQPHDWKVSLGLGLLSSTEKDTKIPICNGLKSPSLPVWIIHGGDHFTLAWQEKPAVGSKFELWHYNGLPPGGPRLAKMGIDAHKGVAKEASNIVEAKYYEPEIDTIDEIVQADPAIKTAHPEQY